MTDAAVAICPSAGVAWEDAPIEPSWIIEGSPVARCGWWSASTDGTTQNFVWDCTAGRFSWHFSADETVHIIEGEVEITADGFETVWLRAGDAALFRSGTSAIWHVPQYVRKHAVIRGVLPAPLRAQLAFGRRLKRIFRGGLDPRSRRGGTSSLRL